MLIAPVILKGSRSIENPSQQLKHIRSGKPWTAWWRANAMMSWSTRVSARCCPTETASSARLSETGASWWWGSTGKFLGRSTCRKGYISATRVGGHCHGDHCDYDQQLDHKVHNLLQTNQGEEFSLQLSSTCCCRNWRPWNSQLFSAVHQLLSEPPVWEFKFSEVLSNQAHTWSLLSLWTDLTLDFIRSIFLLKRSESVIKSIWIFSCYFSHCSQVPWGPNFVQNGDPILSEMGT